MAWKAPSKTQPPFPRRDNAVWLTFDMECGHKRKKSQKTENDVDILKSREIRRHSQEEVDFDDVVFLGLS